MPPRAKRLRSNSDASEDLEDGAVQSIAPPKPHDALWIEDGNIVLATDAHLYRVHRGVLARNSSVFKDMLEIPTGGAEGGADHGTGVDQWEGLPLVKMVGDSDESVSHLLMTLYDRE